MLFIPLSVCQIIRLFIKNLLSFAVYYIFYSVFIYFMRYNTFLCIFSDFPCSIYYFS
nr:MAG TPA: hypothetical protein [Caudoviricetes sp.]